MSVTQERQYEPQARLTFPSPLEKEPHNRNLQSSHSGHHAHLDETEIEYSLLRAPDRAEIAVLPCAEVFLHATNRTQLATDFEHQILECGMLFGRRAGLLWEESRFGFVFDLHYPSLSARMFLGSSVKPRRQTYSNLKVHHLIRECRHLVVEAYPVLARILRRKDKVSLSFFFSTHDLLVIRSHHLVIDVKGAARLNLYARVSSRFRESEETAREAHGEIKGDFGARSLDIREETGLFVRGQFVCQGRAVHA